MLQGVSPAAITRAGGGTRKSAAWDAARLRLAPLPQLRVAGPERRNPAAIAGHDHGPRGIGEADPLRREPAEEREVDGLLDVHVDVVVRAQHVVHGLEVERGLAVLLEVRTVEAHRALRL